MNVVDKSVFEDQFSVLGIDWRITPEEMILSGKDLKGLALDDMTLDFLGF